MRPASSQTERRADGALALQRVLALEGRNALARVELAASELSRFGLVPAAFERVGAIRDAVAELDALLDKIERLAEPVPGIEAGGATRLEEAWQAVQARVAPVLRARGISIEVEGGWVERSVAAPKSVVERLLLLALRIAVGAVEREGAESDGENPRVLCLASRMAPRRDSGRDARMEAGGGAGRAASCESVSEEGVALLVRARSRETGMGFELERAERVELEVALTEQGGRFDLCDEGDGPCLRLWLPEGAADVVA